MGNDVPRPPVKIDENRVESILTSVSAHDLPAPLPELLSDYQQLKAARPLFMWKWVHKLAPSNTLPCVDHSYREKVPLDKTLTILVVTLLDDLLEKTGDKATFTELAKLPHPNQTPRSEAPDVDSAYIEFTERVWTTLTERLQDSPQFERYADLFRYDIKQAINAIEYSDLVIRHPELATMGDIERYESHNMVMFAYADIDLMHTTHEYHSELGTIREAVWHAQKMARIGNWVSTWEREFQEGDYSSAIIVYALEEGIISPADLPADQRSSPDIVESVISRIRDAAVEEHFLDRWADHYAELVDINEQLDGFDLMPYIEGTEEVLDYHLASTGLK